MGHNEGSPQRKVQINTGLPKEDRKISNKQYDPTYKRKRGTTNKAKRK